MPYNKDEVKENISPEDIMLLLNYYDAEPQEFSDYIVSKTICHNGIGEGTHKLYYYYSTQLWKCYTECDDAFDIFELVQKIEHIADLNEAVNWIVNFFNIGYKLTNDEDYSLEDWKLFNTYEKMLEVWNDDQEEKKLEFKTYDPKILMHYPQPEIVPWTNDGIKKEICDYMGIRYDPVSGSILIPHKNKEGQLIGIRRRTLVEEDEKYGKYKPWQRGKELYNHALGFNLYASHEFWDNIKKAQTAIIFEGEKSVLAYQSYFGLRNDIACAVCGNSLSKYQFKMLQDCGVKEIVIAFDKDYHQLNDAEYDAVITRWERIYQKFIVDCNVSFLIDTDDLLGYKCSPIDCGPEKFLRLFRNRYVGV